jgi:hypothetical protein
MEISNMFVDYDLLTNKVIVSIDFNVEYKSTIEFNSFMNKFLDFSKKFINTQVNTKVFIYKKYNFSSLDNAKNQLSQTGSQDN